MPRCDGDGGAGRCAKVPGGETGHTITGRLYGVQVNIDEAWDTGQEVLTRAKPAKEPILFGSADLETRRTKREVYN